MNKAITVDPLTDNSVYGIQQVQYTVDGVPGQNFSDAISAAAFYVATAIEEATSAYSAVVTARQKKVDDLGIALAAFNETNSNLPPKNQKSKDTAEVKDYNRVKQILDYYEISINGFAKTMNRGDIQKAVTEVQYQMDKEDNYLQQDLVSLQSFISKRDNAYNTASKIVKKTNNAAQSTIANIGG